MSPVVEASVITGVLSLVGGGGLTTLVRSLRKAAAPERDSIVVTSSETALVSVQKSLEIAERQRDAAVAENITLRARLDDLQKKLDVAEAALNQARSQLMEIQQNLRDAN